MQNSEGRGDTCIMGKLTLTYKKVVISLLTLGFIASLGANLYWYNSSKAKSADFIRQQHNIMLFEYEQTIVSNSQNILSALDDILVQGKMNQKQLLKLYSDYLTLNRSTLLYPNYVQYNDPLEGKEGASLGKNKLITLRYPFNYFGSTVDLFGRLLVESNYNTDVAINKSLEKSLKFVIELTKTNKDIYEKYINEDFNPSSDEAIWTRLKLKQELIDSYEKLKQLDYVISTM